MKTERGETQKREALRVTTESYDTKEICDTDSPEHVYARKIVKERRDEPSEPMEKVFRELGLK